VKPHTTLADRVVQALIGPGDEAVKMIDYSADS